MALVKKRNVLFELFDKLRTLRPWADKTHITVKYIEDLRQLINTHVTNKFTHFSNARVVLLRPNSTKFFGVGAHRAKFVHLEHFSVQSDTLLTVENRCIQ